MSTTSSGTQAAYRPGVGLGSKVFFTGVVSDMKISAREQGQNPPEALLAVDASFQGKTPPRRATAMVSFLPRG
jgi:hypothetical protein